VTVLAQTLKSGVTVLEAVAEAEALVAKGL
jgi:hypothetical protein